MANWLSSTTGSRQPTEPALPSHSVKVFFSIIYGSQATVASPGGVPSRSMWDCRIAGRTGTLNSTKRLTPRAWALWFCELVRDENPSSNGAKFI